MDNTIGGIALILPCKVQYSNRAVTYACKLQIPNLIFIGAKQNREISSKIDIKKKELLERK